MEARDQSGAQRGRAEIRSRLRFANRECARGSNILPGNRGFTRPLWIEVRNQHAFVGPASRAGLVPQARRGAPQRTTRESVAMLQTTPCRRWDPPGGVASQWDAAASRIVCENGSNSLPRSRVGLVWPCAISGRVHRIQTHYVCVPHRDCAVYFPGPRATVAFRLQPSASPCGQFPMGSPLSVCRIDSQFPAKKRKIVKLASPAEPSVTLSGRGRGHDISSLAGAAFLAQPHRKQPNSKSRRPDPWRERSIKNRTGGAT